MVKSVGTKLEKAIALKFFREGPAGVTGAKFSLGFEVLKRVQEGIKEPLVLGVVIGRVVSYKSKAVADRNTGEILRESVILHGQFEAVRGFDGAVQRAGACYMTNSFIEPMIAALDASENAIDFAVQISVEPNPTAQDGAPPYTWVYHDMIERRGDSPLDAIKRQLVKNDFVQALPAPTQAKLLENAAPVPELVHVPVDSDPDANAGGDWDEEQDDGSEMPAPVSKGKRSR